MNEYDKERHRKAHIEHLKMKNTMCEMKNIQGVINSRLDWRGKISALSKTKHTKIKKTEKIKIVM